MRQESGRNTCSKALVTFLEISPEIPSGLCMAEPPFQTSEDGPAVLYNVVSNYSVSIIMTA